MLLSFNLFFLCHYRTLRNPTFLSKCYLVANCNIAFLCWLELFPFIFSDQYEIK